MTIGALSRIRTTDRSRIRRVLYTTELKAHNAPEGANWHVRQDSNSDEWFWRPSYYHYIMPLKLLNNEQIQFKKIYNN